MIHGEKRCPRYELEFMQMNKMPEIQGLYKQFESLFAYISEHSKIVWKFGNVPFYAFHKAWNLYNYFLGMVLYTYDFVEIDSNRLILYAYSMSSLEKAEYVDTEMGRANFPRTSA